MTARPHRAAPVTYRQAMNALHDAYLTLLNIQQMRLEPNIREQLEMLLDSWLSWWSGTTDADDD